MAGNDNDPSVRDAGGLVRTLREIYVGQDASGRDTWLTGIADSIAEKPTAVAGGTFRHTVTSVSVVSLAPPTAKAHYARLRVFDTTFDPATPSTQNHRLYYRSDGTAPNNTGTTATGFLLHGESILVRVKAYTNFKMVAHAGDSSSFEVYVEWLTWEADSN